MPDYNVTVALGGSVYPTSLTHVAHPASVTLLSGESGSVISNTGAVGTVIYDLPASALGLNYRIVATTGQLITVRPPAGVTIVKGTVTATNANPITSATTGDWINVVNTSATVWTVFASSVDWAI